MAGFTKLFSSILDSTIWQEPNETRLLWITMLAMSDANGEIQSSIPGLARRAAITLEQCEKGLVTLSSPDTYSRTKDHEGRRIEEVTGGWRLLNHGRYRALLSYEERKEYNRIKQAERRAKLNCVNDMSNNVNESKQCQHITDNRVQITDAEAEREREEASPALAHVVPTGRRFPDHAATIARINALRPEWAKPAQWTGAELHALHDAMGQLEELTNDDWDGLKRYFAAYLEKGAGYWQPKSRGQFVGAIADVFANYTRWASKTRRTPRPAAILEPVIKKQPMTPDQIAEMREMLNTKRKP